MCSATSSKVSRVRSSKMAVATAASSMGCCVTCLTPISDAMNRKSLSSCCIKMACLFSKQPERTPPERKSPIMRITAATTTRVSVDIRNEPISSLIKIVATIDDNFVKVTSNVPS